MTLREIVKLPFKVVNRFRFAYSRANECMGINNSWDETFWFFLFKPGVGSNRKCGFHFGDVKFDARIIDWFAIDEVILRGEYVCVDSLLDTIEQPTILDLGANIGMFAVYCLDRKRNATVHSVEASEATFGVLDENRKLNRPLDWQTHYGAVWSTDGHISFADNAEASTGSRISSDSKMQVPSIGLAGLLRRVGRPIDLMKMDIEGAEEEALCAGDVDLSNIRNLIIEIHPNRCNESRVMQRITSEFTFIYKVLGRQSSKPVLVAARSELANVNLQRVK